MQNLNRTRDPRETEVVESGRSWTTQLLLASVMFAHLYYCYRYAFQINSTDTSPTYSDTPVALQVGRYVGGLILAALTWYAWFAEGARSRNNTRAISWTAGSLALALLIVAPTAAGGVSALVSGGLLVKAIYVLPMALSMLLLPARERDLRQVLNAITVWPFAYHVVYSVVQYYLFYYYDRLPALAFAGGLVRFGGGWDDPNAFGMYCSFVICWALLEVEYGSGKAVNLLVALVAIFLMAGTLSYSAGVALLGALLVLFLFTKSAVVRFAIFGLFLTAAGIAAWNWEALLDIRDLKLESAYSRVEQLAGLTQFFEQPLAVILIGYSGGVMYSENMYQFILTNFGLLGVGVLLGFGVWVAMRFWRILMTVRREQVSRFHAQILMASCLFTVIMAVGCLGIPYLSVYPINYLFWSTLVISTMVMPAAQRTPGLRRPLR